MVIKIYDVYMYEFFHFVLVIYHTDRKIVYCLNERS